MAGEVTRPATPAWSTLRRDLQTLHSAAMRAAEPFAAVSSSLAIREGTLLVGRDGEEVPIPGRLRVIAAGKAADGMAAAAAAVLGDRIDGGVVAHPAGGDLTGNGKTTSDGWRRFVGGHPLPDERSLAAGRAVEELLAAATAQDVVLVLLSGGASALLESLLPGVSLGALRQTTEALQRAGADITELNTVRRCLSRLKGGGLARLAAPARVVTLALSDVAGDHREAIGSGPTVPSPTGRADALEVLRNRGIVAPPEVTAAVCELAAEPAVALGDGVYRIVASNQHAADAVVRAAVELGFRSLLLTTFLQGEAREAGRVVGGVAASVAAKGVPVAAPACLVFGGETTVTVRGRGRGGRNLELALGAALALDGWNDVAVLSFATDGVDGSSGAAGAVATGDTLARASALGLSWHQALADNDTEPFFRTLGNLWEGGPTGTNVNDLAIALVYPRS
jgi:hydroxypyruvate reductase